MTAPAAPTYADGSAIPLFYAGVANTSTANMTTPWAGAGQPEQSAAGIPAPADDAPQWQSLNGKWAFQGLPEGTGATDVQTPPATNAHLTGSIVVPYPMESELSGVQQHYDYSFYRRHVQRPGRRGAPAVSGSCSTSAPSTIRRRSG